MFFFTKRAKPGFLKDCSKADRRRKRGFIYSIIGQPGAQEKRNKGLRESDIVKSPPRMQGPLLSSKENSPHSPDVRLLSTRVVTNVSI